MSNKEILSQGQILGISEEGELIGYFDPEEYFAKMLLRQMFVTMEGNSYMKTGLDRNNLNQFMSLFELDYLDLVADQIYFKYKVPFFSLYELARGRAIRDDYKGQGSILDSGSPELWEEKLKMPFWRENLWDNAYDAYSTGDVDKFNECVEIGLSRAREIVATWPDWRGLIDEIDLESSNR